MMTITGEEVYMKYVKDLSITERLKLMELTARDLAAHLRKTNRSLLELEGLGIELWQGIDPQSYVDQIRDEWDHRP